MAVLCIVTYAAALATTYAFRDDYNWILLARAPGYIYGTLAAQGRPIDGAILSFAFRHTSIDLSRWIRLVGILGIGAQGWIIYLAVSRGGFPQRQAFVVGFLTCTLPSSQVYAGWASCVGEPWAGALGGCAGLLAWTALDHLRLRHWAGFILASSAATLTMLIALCTYQPTAMLFCVVAAIDSLGDKGARATQTLRRVAGYACIAGAALAGGWAVFRVESARYAKYLIAHRGGMTHDPAAKLRWFLSEVLPDALNLQNVATSNAAAIVVAAALVCGLLLYFRGAFRDRILRLVLAVVVLPIAYVPNLLADESWAAYRTQAALASALVIFGFLSLHGVAHAVRRPIPAAVFPILASAAAFVAASNVVRYITVPQAIELSLVRMSVLTPGDASRRIYFVPPNWSDSPSPVGRYDEFGMPSTFAFWVQREIVVDVKRDAFGPSAKPGVTIVTPDQLPTLKLEPGSILLDMRNLRNAR
jgi:hypothetical protein